MEYRTMYGVAESSDGDFEVVEVQAAPDPRGGWFIRTNKGCSVWIEHVEQEKLHATRALAEARCDILRQGAP